MTTTLEPTRRHPSPPLWMLAIVATVLFVAGIVIAAAVAGGFTNPYDSDSVVSAYLHRDGVHTALLWSGFTQFGASIPLGLYAATVHSRLNYLGIRAAGTTIALFGGVGASLLLALSGLISWVLSRPEVLASLPTARAMQDLAYVTGGPGQVVLFGLLLAGISVPALIVGLLPRWLALTGLVLALICELASLSLLAYGFTVLIPVGRFVGLAWLIAAGAWLPRARQRREPARIGRLA